MSSDSKAVFLSYASQDAAAARRICDALRAAGVKVWFDQSELRGGDARDHAIRQRIKSCAMCKVKLTVTADGSVRDVSLTHSTGYPRLDQACLEVFVHGGLLPATQDGKPVTTTLEIPIAWKLTR